MLKTLITALAAMFLLTTASQANYHGFSAEDYASFEILPGWRTENGTHMTALRVTMKPGWKTYWRTPGDAGIPPRFDWTGSRNINDVKFHWPTPNVFYQSGMRSLGYSSELVLPIELTPDQVGQEIELRADIELGVCQEICIPVAVRIAADLPATTGTDQRISAALNERPSSARDADVRSATCTSKPISDGVSLTVRVDIPSLSPDEIAVFELPDQTIWVSEASMSREGRILIAVADIVPPTAAPFVIDYSELRITVLGSGRGVDIMGCQAG